MHHYYATAGLCFGFESLGCRDWGVVFRVWGLKVWGFGFRVSGFGFGAQGCFLSITPLSTNLTGETVTSREAFL